ncbi:MAG: HNH endonuclease [Anaerolineae bacterium]|nr:HNH endonuclease [Anaerolineae bacterium]
MSITAAQRRAVIQRAGGCCEYCRASLNDETSPFHVDHIVPIKHQGSDHLDNLCLACYQCNAYKGSNIAAADPVTGEATFLYHPRKQRWDEHFALNDDATLRGITPEGRVTIEVMRINDEARVYYRRIAITLGQYPCF